MRQQAPFILTVGMLVIVVGMAIPIFSGNIQSMAFRWIYAAGAALTLLARFLQPAPDKSLPLRMRRLYRLETWSAFMYCAAAVFVFYDRTQIRDWVAFTMAGAALQAYSAIALTIAYRKLNK